MPWVVKKGNPNTLKSKHPYPYPYPYPYPQRYPYRYP